MKPWCRLSIFAPGKAPRHTETDESGQTGQQDEVGNQQQDQILSPGKCLVIAKDQNECGKDENGR